jgi:methylthioribose-1-phosphate isomerase
MKVEPIRWKKKRLRVLDQTLLPTAEKWIPLDSDRAVWEAIKKLRVRGAPLIGVVAAFGVVVTALKSQKRSHSVCQKTVRKSIDYLAKSRPTAVNLFWALKEMRAVCEKPWHNASELCEALENKAKEIQRDDLEAGRRIGDHGVSLLAGKRNVLTHCNAGVLATSGYGTALAPIYRANEKKQKIHVYVDETRPLLQGSRLTAWELMKAGISMTLICDNMAGTVFRRKGVDAVIVGADRIAANGDTANKIGTYPLAVLAKAHKVPFYVAAPLSTIDSSLRTGDSIPIEERAAEEITAGFGKRTAPNRVRTFSPAFDVTPSNLIDAIITEVGVLKSPFTRSIAKAIRSCKSRSKQRR